MGLNVFHKFDEKNVITGLPIFHFERKNVKFVITIFCLVKDIDFEKENKLFVSLYYKHILGYHYKRYGQADWELPKEKKLLSQSTVLCIFLLLRRRKSILIFPCTNFFSSRK